MLVKGIEVVSFSTFVKLSIFTLPCFASLVNYFTFIEKVLHDLNKFYLNLFSAILAVFSEYPRVSKGHLWTLNRKLFL